MRRGGMAAVLGIAAALMSFSAGANEGGQMTEASNGYAAYSGRESALMVRFEYPAEWKVQEERGTIDAYRQVRVLGPRNADDTYTPYVSVRSSPRRAFGGRYETAAEVVAGYKAHLFKGAEIEAERERTVGGVKATDVTASFIVPAQHKPKLKPLPIPVKTRVVVLEDDPYIYELIYSADAREYDRSAPAFERLLKTFALQ